MDSVVSPEESTFLEMSENVGMIKEHELRVILLICTTSEKQGEYTKTIYFESKKKNALRAKGYEEDGEFRKINRIIGRDERAHVHTAHHCHRCHDWEATDLASQICWEAYLSFHDWERDKYATLPWQHYTQ